MSIKNYFSENILLPISDVMTNNTISSHLKFLLKSQYWTREQLDNYQNDRLRILIKSAYSMVPFYRDLFTSLKLHPNDIKTKEDLIKLPVLSKNEIKKEGIKRFTSISFPNSKKINSSSSGSTGEPLFYLNTKDAYSMNIAANLRGWNWMGFRLGDKYVKLSQNNRLNPIKKMQDRISQNLYLPTNPLIDANFEHIFNEIEKYKPGFIRCYPDPLLFLAQYKSNHPEFKHRPVAINTTGNILFPEARREIESAFGCKIFDSYSCEGNSTVFECSTHNCYHSTEEYGITEVLNERGDRIKKGIGRLITTDLWNIVHPFIRYDTQDYIEVDDSPCECGRNLLQIKKIIGRDNEILIMESGRKFIVHNFTGFFQLDDPQIKRSIDQFQIVKKKNGTVLFLLVVNKNFDCSVNNYIQKYWENELKTNVVVESVSEIPLTKSGKRRFIINEN